jgi:hypothetical protein
MQPLLDVRRQVFGGSDDTTLPNRCEMRTFAFWEAILVASRGTSTIACVAGNCHSRANDGIPKAVHEQSKQHAAEWVRFWRAVILRKMTSVSRSTR